MSVTYVCVTSKRMALVGACATALIVLGCADTGQLPTSPSGSGPVALASTDGDEATPIATTSLRSGALHITKECSENNGGPGAFCTFTASNIAGLDVGTRVIYRSAQGPTSLDSEVILDPPGPGNNKAFGHCYLEFATGTGLCTFSGGTGRFTHFQASAAVSYLGGFDFAWDGTFSLVPHD